MANYPTGKDALTENIKGTDPMANHAELHNMVNSAVNAIQDFVGVSEGTDKETITGAINIIAETIQAIEIYLGISIDGGTITPDGKPNFLPVGDSKYVDAKEIEVAIAALNKSIEDLSGGEGIDLGDYLKKGEGLVATSAKVLEDAITGNTEKITELTEEVNFNKTSINNLAGSLGLEVDVDGNVIISPNPGPDNPPLLDIDGKFDKGDTGPTNYKTAEAMETAIDKNAADITTNTTNIGDLVTNLGGSVDIDGNITYPGNGTPIDISGLATKDELSVEKVEREEGDKESVKEAKEYTDAEIVKEADERKLGDSTNASAITDNTTSINAISNRLDALENTSLSADWKIAHFDGASPADGELSLNSTDWITVSVLNFSNKDNNGTEHDFGAVKAGDTIQIGVGASGRAAGSSAAYEVTGLGDSAGKFDVKHLASTGTPTEGFIAVVAVYPAFDPSTYATQVELKEVEKKADNKVAMLPNGTDNTKTTGVMALTQEQYETLEPKDPLTIYLISDYVDPLPDLLAAKFDLGTGTTALHDATVMEAAINVNKDAIAVLDGKVIGVSTNLNTLIENLGGSVDVDGNIITIPDIDLSSLATKDELNTKFDKGATGPTNYTTAKLMEAAIDKNAADIAAINANGAYDDTALRGLISDEEAARITGDATTLSSSKTYTNQEIAKIVVPDVSNFATKTEVADGDATTLTTANTYTNKEIAKIPATDVSNLATKNELSTGLAGKADKSHNHNNYAPTDHIHIQTGSGLTFDPSRKGQVVQSTNGTDWTAGMSLRVVTSVPNNTEGVVGDVVFVVG